MLCFYITFRFSYFHCPLVNTVSEGWTGMTTVLQRSLPLCEQRQLHSVHRSAASFRCFWLITLSNYTTVSCSKLINNRSREGGPQPPRWSEIVTPSSLQYLLCSILYGTLWYCFWIRWNNVMILSWFIGLVRSQWKDNKKMLLSLSVCPQTTRERINVWIFMEADTENFN